MVDVESREIKFWLNNEKVSFNIWNYIKQPIDLQIILPIDVINKKAKNFIDVILLDDHLVGVLSNFKRNKVEEFDKLVSYLMGLGLYTMNPIKFYLDLKNHQNTPAKPLFSSHQKIN